MAQRVLVVDDHPQVAELLGLYLTDRYDLATAADTVQMEAQLKKQKVDLVVLDLDLKDGNNGLDSIPRLRDAGILVLVFSGTLDQAAIRNCVHNKVAGVMDKKEQIKALAKAIDDVIAGHRILPDYLLYALSGKPEDQMPRLSNRQMQVLNALMEVPMLRNSDIATVLGLSPPRITNLIRELCTKLNAEDRNSLVFEAKRRGHRPSIALPKKGTRQRSV